jgi:hypothetical protein
LTTDASILPTWQKLYDSHQSHDSLSPTIPTIVTNQHDTTSFNVHNEEIAHGGAQMSMRTVGNVRIVDFLKSNPNREMTPELLTEGSGLSWVEVKAALEELKTRGEVREIKPGVFMYGC